ncbi:regulator of G-protein signaling 21-like isoform X2 [Dunckerocampus dactyliophorus]|uniref:regulator of G-protein signaling 21-like isoform X2 n=1 Tax=Dunckerocampus dactyliophorus TaxID=161453 RepID=UPI0024062AB1|nr:regulator of G-protein signaling 21-like isoform X2 [Dunckerocampus dactyliophorus]
MSKYFFSKIGLVKIKDLFGLLKQSRRIHIVLNHQCRKYIKSIKGSREKYSAKLSLQTDHEHQPTLEHLLQDKVYIAAFHSYLQSEFSDENIEFWLACENFRATASSDNLQRKVREIYKEFIQPTATKEINVDHSVREEIKKSLDKPSLTCFNEAQKHVYLLMERDSRPRFLQSIAYLRLKHKSRTLWYI